MPTKNKAKERFNDVKFVTYSLSREQAKDLKARDLSLEQLDDTALKLSEAGYKITFRFDDYNQCHACWLIPSMDKVPNFGFILTGRGSTPLKAFKQVCYIHFELFEGDWAEHYIDRNREELDD